jgi:hypothetical protein
MLIFELDPLVIGLWLSYRHLATKGKQAARLPGALDRHLQGAAV